MLLSAVAQKPCKARDSSVSADTFRRAVMPAGTFERWQAARKVSYTEANARLIPGDSARLAARRKSDASRVA
eukprot:7419186-Alexandrium_andersonii.AAC.1